MSTKKRPSRRVVAVLELRRSNAARPHDHRSTRGADRRAAITEDRE